jgi:integrase
VLRKLTGGNVHAFLAKLARTHGTNPVRVIHRTLKRVIRFAMARDMVTRNVAEPIVTPDGQDRRKATAMTAEQAETLLKAVDGTRLEPLVILCLWGCLRRGEALALRWQDVDLETGKLKISRSLSMHDGKVVIGKVKTKASKRTIGLPDEIAPTGRSTLALTSGGLTTMRDGEVILLPRALKALRRWKTRQAAERLEFAGPYEDHDLIVCREDGRPLRPLSALRAFLKATERAGLGRAWRIHELRHTGASLYLEAGVPIHVISAYLGHADVSITAKIYLHYTAESVTLSGGTLKVAGSQ